jgi:hypothetical protein
MPVFERVKTIHALDRAATVIGHTVTGGHKYRDLFSSLRIWTRGVHLAL